MVPVAIKTHFGRLRVFAIRNYHQEQCALGSFYLFNIPAEVLELLVLNSRVLSVVALHFWRARRKSPVCGFAALASILASSDSSPAV